MVLISFLRRQESRSLWACFRCHSLRKRQAGSDFSGLKQAHRFLGRDLRGIGMAGFLGGFLSLDRMIPIKRDDSAPCNRSRYNRYNRYVR